MIKNFIKYVSKNIYIHSYKYILIFWTLFSFMLFVQINYNVCIYPYEDGFRSLALVFLSLSFIFISLTLVHFLVYKNDKLAMDDVTDDGTINSIGVIVPLYALWIFSFSKIIIYTYNFFTNKIDVNIFQIHITIWGAVFLGSGYFWFKYLNQSDKKFDLALTIIVVFITAIQIFWTSFFLPLTKSTIEIGSCISNKIVNEKVLEKENVR